MNKNTILGFIAIGAIMFGFSWYQSSQLKDRVKAEQETKTKQQIEMVEEGLIASEQASIADSLNNVAEENLTEAAPQQEETVAVNVQEVQMPYKSELLNDAYYASVPQFDTLSTDLVEIVLTTKGAQPYSVRLKKYNAYNPEDPDSPKELFFVRPGASDYNISLDLAERVSGTKNTLDTRDFCFQLDKEQSSDNVVVMKLPYEGGYIQQKYWIDNDSYMLKNELSFIGMNQIVDDITDTYTTDWKLYIPRLEKGYKNEKQYSKLDYYFSGEDDVEEIAEGTDEHARVSSRLKWFAFQQQFFSAIVTPAKEFDGADFTVNYYSDKEYEEFGNLMVCKAKMYSSFPTKSENVVAACDFYIGPNDYKTLKSYDRHYEDIIPLGSWIVSWFSKWVIIPVFDFLGKFISNYGIIILLMTILIKLLLTPLTLKSYKSTAKMQVLKPEMDKLNEKYPKPEDAMKKQQAMMNLYQKAGVSPMGGCLPMLLQMPILFAMFRFFPASIELRQQSFLWADDLSAYDSIIEFGHIPLLGDHISLFALLMALSMFFYSKISSAQMADGGMPGMKFMSLYLMPIMMFFICNSLSSALSYYYLLSNLITMGMTWYIRKYVVTEEKVRAQMAAAAAKPRQKSKWQLRLEEAQRMQEQMQKERRNRR